MARPLRILVVGSGGREHALAWRIARDPEVGEVLVAPGNDAMARDFTRLPIDALDARGLLDAARARSVDLAVIGPEAPMAAGLADVLREALPVFGPGARGAQLESSKWFAKQFMLEAGIPTASAVLWEDGARALRDVASARFPLVLKADGLAAGKGVCVSQSRAEAEAFIRAVMVDGALGEAGRRVLREDCLVGDEMSLVLVTDGRHYRLLPAARDYKRAFEGDQGPNTGGMGTFAPAPALDPVLEERLSREVVEPTLAALARRGIDYRGALYCGLMLTEAGPRVLEYNCRFGDPETEVVMPLLEESFTAMLAGAAHGALEGGRRVQSSGAAVDVVVADEGYPDAVRRTGVIEGLDALERTPGILLFHAGTEKAEGGWRITGGRAVHVVGCADTVEAARTKAYAAVDRLSGTGWRVRRDIASLPAATRGGS